MPDAPFTRHWDSFQQALELACNEPTLLDALTRIVIWESGRVVRQARGYFETGVSQGANGAGWDTCFKRVLEAVLRNYGSKKDRALSKPLARTLRLGRYRSYKGKFYQVLELVSNPETSFNQRVIYKALQGKCKVHVLSPGVFLSNTLDAEGHSVPRFSYCPEIVE